MQHDLYSALGVASSESDSGIHAAFRDLNRRFHPNRTGPGGRETYREIVQAYAVLANPSSREHYDRTGPTEPEETRERRLEGAQGEPIEVLSLEEVGTVRPGIEELLARIERNFSGRSVPKAEIAEALAMQVHVSPERAARGGVLELRLPIYHRCTSCGGRGSTLLLQCARCLGSGLVQARRARPMDLPAGIDEHTELVRSLTDYGIYNLYAQVHVALDAASAMI